MIFRRRRNDYGKDVIYVSIKEALSKEGCPICRLLRKLEIEAIENLLYEHVLDPQVRNELRRNLGFCNYHSWLLVDYVLKNPWIGQLGVSIIYEDLLSTYLSKLREGEIVSNKDCELCRRVKYFEETYVNAFAKYLSSLDLINDYRESPSILCSKHLRYVIKSINDEDLKNDLMSIQVSKAEKVLDRLRSFIKKQDYRVKEGISREEASAWRLALEIIVGANASVNVLEVIKTQKGTSTTHEVGHVLKRLFRRY